MVAKFFFQLFVNIQKRLRGSRKINYKVFHILDSNEIKSVLITILYIDIYDKSNFILYTYRVIKKIDAARL